MTEEFSAGSAAERGEEVHAHAYGYVYASATGERMDMCVSGWVVGE